MTALSSLASIAPVLRQGQSRSGAHTMDRRQYRNPPIEEALCEVRFVPDPNWNLTLIGALREHLKDSYPGQPREQVTLELGMEIDSGRESSATPPHPALSLTHGLS